MMGAMTVKKEPEIKEIEQTIPKPDDDAVERPSGESEFKLTVRKLEMPIRPRGVLAE